MKKIDIYKQEIERLEDEHGGVTAEIVVREAKKKSSPFHDYFDWNDKTAAYRHRIDQARELIRNIRVEIEVVERTIDLPNYVRDPARLTNEQGYRNIANIRSDEDAKREVIVAEFARAASALRRARDLAAYFGVEEQIDDTLDSILRVKDRLDPAHA